MKAILAGTFDPFTSGHADLAARAVAAFGNVTVAVAAETGKACAPLDVRLNIARLSLAAIENAQVVAFDGLLTDYIKKQGECVLIRGARNGRDFEYECEHSAVYRSLCDIDFIVFPTKPELAHVSSTNVRTLAALGVTDELAAYVVPSAIAEIIKVYGKAR